MAPHLTLARMRLFAVALLAALTAAAPQSAARTTLHFGHLWDGSRLLDDVVIVVDEGRITSVTPGQKPPRGAVDLRRFTAIPGLIDLHTHITYFWDRKAGTRPLAQPRRRPAVTVFLAQENARRTLESGVTTVRALGASNDTDT